MKGLFSRLIRIESLWTHIVWALICFALAFTAVTFLPSGETRPAENVTASKPTIYMEPSTEGIQETGLEDLWFSPDGVLVGVRQRGESVEILKWRDPDNLRDLDKKEVNLTQLAAPLRKPSLQPKESAKPSLPIFAIAKDASKIAVVVGNTLIVQSLHDGANKTFSLRSSMEVSTVAFTNKKLIILYKDGYLKSLDPNNLSIQTYQSTNLSAPSGLWARGDHVAAASFNDFIIEFYNVERTSSSEFIGDSYYQNAEKIGSDSFGLSKLDSFVAALSPEGGYAYSIGNTEVKYHLPGAKISTFKASGPVTGLAIDKSYVLAVGKFDGVWLLDVRIDAIVGEISNNAKLVAVALPYLAYSNDLGTYTDRWVSTSPPPPPVSFWTTYGSLLRGLIWGAAILLALAPLIRYALFRPKAEAKPTVALVGSDTPGPGRDEPPLSLPLPLPPDGLVKACAVGECVLYAGAGLSIQAGFPSWYSFVESLLSWSVEQKFIEPSIASSLESALALREIDSVSDYLANILQNHKPELNRFLLDTFGGEVKTTPALEALNQIRFSAVLTTNYDRLLEESFREHKPLIYTPADTEPLLEAFTKRDFFILKLIGALERPDTIMLSPAQYEEFVRRHITFAQFMDTLFFSRTLLFVGASLDGIEDFLKGVSSSPQIPRAHYALVGVDGGAWQAKALQIERRYGVKILPFTPGPEYKEVQQFLEEFARRVEIEAGAMTPPTGPVARLKKVILSDIGPFDELEVELDPNLTVILGDNGVGKSSILKAIATSICGEEAKAYAGRLVKHPNPSGQVTLVTDRKTYTTNIFKKNGGAKVESLPGRPLEAEGWLVLGFPPLRAVSWERPTVKESETRRRPAPEDLLPLVSGTPDPRIDKLKQWIVNIDYWIKDARDRQIDPSRYENLLKKFFEIARELTKDDSLTFKEVRAQTNEVRIMTRDGELPIEAVSQGMISLIGWVGVLLQRLYEVYGTEEDPTEHYALVLMDEIDAHMHPAWQQSLVRDLKKVFPNIQFIATTHSPLIVAGLKPAQIVRFARDDESKVIRYIVTEEMTIGRADQILAGDLFGLQSTFTLSEDLEGNMKEYHRLLAKGEKRDQEEEFNFQMLRQSLKARIPAVGEMPAERRALELIRALVRDDPQGANNDNEEAIINKAQQLLEELSKKKK